MLIDEHSPSLLRELHHIPDILGWCDDLELRYRLLDMDEVPLFRKVFGVRYGNPSTLISLEFNGLRFESFEQLCLISCKQYPVGDLGTGDDDIHFKLPPKSLFDDIEMEESEESASESISERRRGFVLDLKGRVVELEFFDTVLQLIVLIIIDRVDSSEDEWSDTLESPDGIRIAAVVSREERISDSSLRNRFESGDDVSDLPFPDRFAGIVFRCEESDLIHFDLRPRVEEFELITALDASGEQLQIHDDSLIGIVLGIEDQCLDDAIILDNRRILDKRRLLIKLLRERDFLDKHIQQIPYPFSGFRTHSQYILFRTAEEGDDLVPHPLDIGRWEVDLIQDRNDLEIVLYRKIDVGECLRLDSLCRIDDQERSLHGSKAP